MIIMVANRQLVGDWGNADPGSEFEASEEQALDLESRGLAYRWRPPVAPKMKPPHPNKMLTPMENK